MTTSGTQPSGPRTSTKRQRDSDNEGSQPAKENAAPPRRKPGRPPGAKDKTKRFPRGSGGKKEFNKKKKKDDLARANARPPVNTPHAGPSHIYHHQTQQPRDFSRDSPYSVNPLNQFSASQVRGTVHSQHSHVGYGGREWADPGVPSQFDRRIGMHTGGDPRHLATYAPSSDFPGTNVAPPPVPDTSVYGTLPSQPSYPVQNMPGLQYDLPASSQQTGLVPFGQQQQSSSAQLQPPSSYPYHQAPDALQQQPPISFPQVYNTPSLVNPISGQPNLPLVQPRTTSQQRADAPIYTAPPAMPMAESSQQAHNTAGNPLLETVFPKDSAPVPWYPMACMNTLPSSFTLTGTGDGGRFNEPQRENWDYSRGAPAQLTEHNLPDATPVDNAASAVDWTAPFAQPPWLPTEPSANTAVMGENMTSLGHSQIIPFQPTEPNPPTATQPSLLTTTTDRIVREVPFDPSQPAPTLPTGTEDYMALQYLLDATADFAVDGPEVSLGHSQTTPVPPTEHNPSDANTDGVADFDINAQIKEWFEYPLTPMPPVEHNAPATSQPSGEASAVSDVDYLAEQSLQTTTAAPSVPIFRLSASIGNCNTSLNDLSCEALLEWYSAIGSLSPSTVPTTLQDPSPLIPSPGPPQAHAFTVEEEAQQTLSSRSPATHHAPSAAESQGPEAQVHSLQPTADGSPTPADSPIPTPCDSPKATAVREVASTLTPCEGKESDAAAPQVSHPLRNTYVPSPSPTGSPAKAGNKRARGDDSEQEATPLKRARVASDHLVSQPSAATTDQCNPAGSSAKPRNKRARGDDSEERATPLKKSRVASDNLVLGTSADSTGRCNAESESRDPQLPQSERAMPELPQPTPCATEAEPAHAQPAQSYQPFEELSPSWLQALAGSSIFSDMFSGADNVGDATIYNAGASSTAPARSIDEMD